MMRLPPDRKPVPTTGPNWEVRELDEAEQKRLGIAVYDGGVLRSRG